MIQKQSNTTRFPTSNYYSPLLLVILQICLLLNFAHLQPARDLNVTFKTNVKGQTSWFASPLIYDMDGDGENELLCAYYNIYAYDSSLTLLDTYPLSNRVYAPHAICDLDQDGQPELVAGSGWNVYALNFVNQKFQLKAGWPSSINVTSKFVEVRSLACADLEGLGQRQQVIVSTTETLDEKDGGSQVHVLASDGSSYQPAGATVNPAWPRYNYRAGVGNDLERNGCGLNGYGAYGLNVGIGNLDDEATDLEVVVTYDNHEIEVFKKDGVAVDVSDFYRSRSSQCFDERLTWGQFIRWADPVVESNHYHFHNGTWPNVGQGQEWLQWTASPPNVADLNKDGLNEVIGIPNIEKYIPYETQAYGIVVFQGSQNGGVNGGKRFPGFEIIPRGRKPTFVSKCPRGIPAPTIADVTGDGYLEIITSLNDGYLYCVNYKGELIWTFKYAISSNLYATEVTLADLDNDNKPEIIFATYGSSFNLEAGNLIILNREGGMLNSIPLPNPSKSNGNGNGAPTPPTVGDLDGDGELEIYVQTFEHGMDVFVVGGSSGNCLLWPTSRGSHLRMGSLPANFKSGTCGTSDPMQYTPKSWNFQNDDEVIVDDGVAVTVGVVLTLLFSVGIVTYVIFVKKKGHKFGYPIIQSSSTTTPRK